MSSLFPYPDIYISQFKKLFSIEPSKEFVSCLDQQLTNSFELQTGLRPNRRIEIGWAHGPAFFYTIDKISRFAAELWVNNQNSPITIAWQSLSGKIYQLTDTSIDCNDIRFWMEDIDAALYSRQLYPKINAPFGISDLPFTITVERLNIDMIVEIYLKESAVAHADEIIKEIDRFLNDFNTSSEKKQRSNGVIHKWQREFRENMLVYNIDLGSAGLPAAKKLINCLAKIDSFTEVKII